jgi:hypothetical protein
MRTSGFVDFIFCPVGTGNANIPHDLLLPDAINIRKSVKYLILFVTVIIVVIFSVTLIHITYVPFELKNCGRFYSCLQREASNEKNANAMDKLNMVKIAGCCGLFNYDPADLVPELSKFSGDGIIYDQE